MLFLTTPSPEGRTVMVDLSTSSTHRVYSNDPSKSASSIAYIRATDSLVLPQSKPCVYQFSPCMQQPVQRSFTAEALTALAVSSCSTMLIAGSGESGSIFVWNILTGELLRIFKGHLRKVTCIAVSHDGQQFASSSDDCTCKVWTLTEILGTTQTSMTADVTFTAHTLPVTACCFLYTARVVATGSLDRCVKLFSSATGTQMLSIMMDVGLTALCPSVDDGRLLIGGDDGQLSVLFLRPGKTNDDRSAAVPAAAAASSSLLPTGRDPASSSPQLLKRVPVEGGHAKRILSVCFLSFPHSHHAIVASENGRVLLWDTDTLRVLQDIATVKKGLCAALFVPHLSVAGISTVKHDKVVGLSKYPVDLLGSTGYSIVPVDKPGLTLDGAHPQSIPLAAPPSVQYNKAKRKRLREEFLKAQAEAQEQQKQAEARRQQRRNELEDLQKKEQQLEHMAQKLRERITLLEARRGVENHN